MIWILILLVLIFGLGGGWASYRANGPGYGISIGGVVIILIILLLLFGR